MDKPKFVYIAGINLAGLWSKKPLKAKLDPDSGYYYDRSNILSTDCLGQSNKYGIITFTSTNKDEVQIWINGILSASTLLKAWLR